MAGSRLVKDVMVPTVQLEVNARIGDALQTLDLMGCEYGVVSDESGRSHVIVTREQLKAAETDECLQTLTANVPHSMAIKPDIRLNSIVQMLAEDLAIGLDFTGLVVHDQGEVLGVLLRETIQGHAWDILDQSHLFGSFLKDPRSRGNIVRVPKPMLYECPVCHKKRLVDGRTLDPDNPPTCSDRHATCVMMRI